MKAAQQGLIKTSAHFSGKMEACFRLISNQERAKMPAAALGRGITANHEFLLLMELEFYPRPAPAPGFVNGILSFAHEAFQTETARFFQQFIGRTVQRGRIAKDFRAFFEKFFQQIFSSQ